MRKQKGAALLLAAMMLILAVGVPLLLRLLQSSTIKTTMASESLAKLASVDDALLAFAVSNRRLPCPANGAIASSSAGVGTETRDANGDCTSQSTGVVPWVTLGITEAQITDGWGGRFTYRVPTGPLGLTRNGAFDATFCDPIGSNLVLTPATASTAVACTNGCISLAAAGLLGPPNTTCNPPALFLTGRGLTVRDGTGSVIRNPVAGTGAAYVVIGHGFEGGGAFNSGGILQASSVSAGANGEVLNLNNQPIPGAGFFHDASIQTGNASGSAHFDDVMSHPTIDALLGKTGLGARNH